MKGRNWIEHLLSMRMYGKRKLRLPDSETVKVTKGK